MAFRYDCLSGKGFFNILGNDQRRGTVKDEMMKIYEEITGRFRFDKSDAEKPVMSYGYL